MKPSDELYRGWFLELLAVSHQRSNHEGDLKFTFTFERICERFNNGIERRVLERNATCESVSHVLHLPGLILTRRRVG